jgi:hypothetical protein
MTVSIIALGVIVVLFVLLERNHRRNRGPGSRFAGSNHVYDADLARVRAELATREPLAQDAAPEPSRLGSFITRLAYAFQRPAK